MRYRTIVWYKQDDSVIVKSFIYDTEQKSVVHIQFGNMYKNFKQSYNWMPICHDANELFNLDKNIDSYWCLVCSSDSLEECYAQFILEVL